MNELLDFLSTFRSQLGLTQSQLAQRLGLTVRQINYVESKPASGKIKSEILDKYLLNFRDRMPPNIVDLISNNIVNEGVPSFPEDPFIFEDEFVIQQQAFLSKYDWNYSIWFINMAEIAMLESQPLEQCWAQNISNGINYSVIWDLSFLMGDYANKLEHFIGACQRILDNVHVIEQGDQETSREQPGIDIYAFYSALHLKSTFAQSGSAKESGLIDHSLIEDYIKAWRYFDAKSEYKNRLRIHIPFAEEEFTLRPNKYWRLFKDTTIKNAGLVLYKKSPFSKGKSVAVLEPNRTCSGFFSKKEHQRGFLFLGESIADHYIEGIDNFHKWFKREYNTDENITRFRKNTSNNNGNIDYLLTLNDTKK